MFADDAGGENLDKYLVTHIKANVKYLLVICDKENYFNQRVRMLKWPLMANPR